MKLLRGPGLLKVDSQEMCNCRAGPTKASEEWPWRRVWDEEQATKQLLLLNNNTNTGSPPGIIRFFFVLLCLPSPPSPLPRTPPSSSHPRIRCAPTPRCGFANGCSCIGGSGVGLSSSPPPSSSSSSSSAPPPATAFLMAFTRGPIAPGVGQALLGIQTSGLGLGLGLGLALGLGLGCERAAVAWLLGSGKVTAMGIC